MADKTLGRTAFALLLCTLVNSNIAPSCMTTSSDAHLCSMPLDDITVVIPGEFLVAKLQCYGCPTAERLERGHHRITHEDNALFFNISLSSDRTEVLLNSVPIVPRIPSSRRRIYAPQIPLNFSLASMSSTIECTQQPCRNFGGKCDCFPVALGGMDLSYDYTLLPPPQSANTEGLHQQWTVRFDALGGNNGYMADPYAVFDSSQQKILQIDVKQYGNGVLEIMDTTRLLERRQRPEASKPELNLWQKFIKFLGFGNKEDDHPGHIVHLQPERHSSEKEETFGYRLRKFWGEWPWTMSIIIGFTGLGCFAILYAFARLVLLAYSPSSNQVHGGSANADEDKYHETERLLDGEYDGSEA